MTSLFHELFPATQFRLCDLEAFYLFTFLKFCPNVKSNQWPGSLSPGHQVSMLATILPQLLVKVMHLWCCCHHFFLPLGSCWDLLELKAWILYVFLGPARLILSFQSSLETWEKRLTSNALKSVVLQESDWANIYHVLEEWALMLDKAVEQNEVPLQSPDNEEAPQNTRYNITIITWLAKWHRYSCFSCSGSIKKMTFFFYFP